MIRRRLIYIDPLAQRWRLETLQVEMLEKDPREDYFVLSGEPLCQYLLRRDPGALVIARGPMPFLSGNKASVGYLSPLTGVPHYSFVGGRAAAQLLNLGLDAICFQANQQVGKSANQQISELANQRASESASQRISNLQSPVSSLPIVVISGRAPNLSVTFKPSDALPSGQRSAFYWLLERELGGNRHAGSIFTIGEGARLGYASANLAGEAIYHAGRGGAGEVFARFAPALVLRGEPMEPAEFFAGVSPPLGEGLGGGGSFARNPNAAIAPLVDKYCARLAGKTGGTITKLFTSGAATDGRNTLPARNAQQIGYKLADLGGPQVLKATRRGQTGCHWCQVDCRHYHWVDVDYAPGGRDMFLDDFEPTYAIFAMLGLEPTKDTLQGRLDLLADVDERLILPVEQMGCDIINVGLGLSALFEGVKKGLIPPDGAPDFIAKGASLEGAARAAEMLRSGQASEYPALRAVGDGPQALAQAYPQMQDIVFTGGKGTLGNAGHANALWTFLMPFSRFFGHYVGQLYKIDEPLPPPGSDDDAYRACFERVVRRMLGKEFFWVLCNAFSMCAFTFVIFSQDGEGERLSDDGLLLRLLHHYGIQATRADLEWFAQAFWAQSIDLKCQFGWRPPSAADFPHRVYEALSLALDQTPEDLQALMEMLIDEWKRHAGEVMEQFGYEGI
jgi:aldehyde:ferredoxin oxidoreductase